MKLLEEPWGCLPEDSVSHNLRTIDLNHTLKQEEKNVEDSVIIISIATYFHEKT